MKKVLFNNLTLINFYLKFVILNGVCFTVEILYKNNFCNDVSLNWYNY